MESILKILSPATAPYALIACITDIATCNNGLMTDKQRVEKIIAAVREFDELFPSPPISLMLESYDTREQIKRRDGK